MCCSICVCTLYVYVCMCIYIYIYVCIYIYVYVNLHVYIYIYIFVYLHIHICTLYIFRYLSLYIYIYMHISIYVYTYVKRSTRPTRWRARRWAVMKGKSMARTRRARRWRGSSTTACRRPWPRNLYFLVTGAVRSLVKKVASHEATRKQISLWAP